MRKAKAENAIGSTWVTLRRFEHWQRQWRGQKDLSKSVRLPSPPSTVITSTSRRSSSLLWSQLSNSSSAQSPHFRGSGHYTESATDQSPQRIDHDDRPRGVAGVHAETERVRSTPRTWAATSTSIPIDQNAKSKMEKCVNESGIAVEMASDMTSKLEAESKMTGLLGSPFDGLEIHLQRLF